MIRRNMGFDHASVADNRASRWPLCLLRCTSHGRYTAEALASRSEVSALIRAMKGLVAAVNGDD
jgi:hypothetical protein